MEAVKTKVPNSLWSDFSSLLTGKCKMRRSSEPLKVFLIILWLFFRLSKVCPRNLKLGRILSDLCKVLNNISTQRITFSTLFEPDDSLSQMIFIPKAEADP